MKRSIFFVCLLLSAVMVSGLEITIVDFKNNPLPDTAVALAELGLDGYTDSQGKVVFSGISPGNYTVLAALPGYEKLKQTINLLTGEEKIVLKLNMVVIEVGETKINEKRNKGEVTAQTTMKEEDMDNTTQSVMNDAAKIIQTMPGVSGSSDSFDSSMYIQGGDNFEWVARMDGVYILNPTRWGGHITMFNPTVVESLDLYTAGFPAKFVQGLAGILDVKVKEGNDSSWDGFFDLSAASSEISLGGPLGSGSNIYFNLRRTWYDFVAPLFLSEEDRKGIQFPYLWDGICKVSFDLSPADKLSILAYGSNEGMKWRMDLEDDGEEAGEGEFKYDLFNFIASLRYTHSFNEKDYMDTMIAVVPMFGTGDFTNSSIQGENWESTQLFLEAGQDFYINSASGHKFALGAAFLTGLINGEDENWYYVFDKDKNWVKVEENMKLDSLVPLYGALYAMDDWEIFPHFILQAGVTADGYLNNKEVNVMPRGGFKYEITPELDVFVRGGMYNSYPFDASLLDKDIGNPDLKASKALHATSGIDYSDDSYVFLIEGFYKYYYDLPMYDMGTNYNNNGVRHAAGFDVYLQKKASKDGWINGWIAYTFVYAKEKVLDRTSPEGGQDPYSQPVDEWYTPSFVSNHTLSAVLELTYHKNEATPILNWLDKCKISFDFRLLSGKPYTPATDVDIKTIDGVDRYAFTYGDYNSKNMPLTYKLDIKVTMPYSLFSLLNLCGMNLESSSYISFINVFNNKNVYSFYYDVDDSNNLVRREMKDYPFMILGGMRVEF
jgi:hypothetical protein